MTSHDPQASRREVKSNRKPISATAETLAICTITNPVCVLLLFLGVLFESKKSL